MEKELHDRLLKIADLHGRPTEYTKLLMFDTLAVLESIRSHQCQCHPERDGECLVITDAIEIVKDYR